MWLMAIAEFQSSRSCLPLKPVRLMPSVGTPLLFVVTPSSVQGESGYCVQGRC